MQVRTDSSDLNILNSARRKRGLPSYQYDEKLTEVASERANRMARQGRMKHLFGSYSPGRAEGISMTSSKSRNPISNACFAMSRRFQTAGAKCVTGSNGKKYCSLILR